MWYTYFYLMWNLFYLPFESQFCDRPRIITVNPAYHITLRIWHLLRSHIDYEYGIKLIKKTWTILISWGSFWTWVSPAHIWDGIKAYRRSDIGSPSTVQKSIWSHRFSSTIHNKKNISISLLLIFNPWCEGCVETWYPSVTRYG